MNRTPKKTRPESQSFFFRIGRLVGWFIITLSLSKLTLVTPLTCLSLSLSFLVFSESKERARERERKIVPPLRKAYDLIAHAHVVSFPQISRQDAKSSDRHIRPAQFQGDEWPRCAFLSFAHVVVQLRTPTSIIVSNDRTGRERGARTHARTRRARKRGE
jgi:hypothetical protein